MNGYDTISPFPDPIPVLIQTPPLLAQPIPRPYSLLGQTICSRIPSASSATFFPSFPSRCSPLLRRGGRDGENGVASADPIQSPSARPLTRRRDRAIAAIRHPVSPSALHSPQNPAAAAPSLRQTSVCSPLDLPKVRVCPASPAHFLAPDILFFSQAMCLCRSDLWFSALRIRLRFVGAVIKFASL
jgi:hypothetical protein